MSLKRDLGLPAITFTAIGMILGAGIYTLIGKAAGQAGTSLWLSFAGAAVVAALTGLSYAELATAYPKAGAEVVYLRAAMPRLRWAPIVVGVILVVAKVATAATVSLAFAGYLGTFVEVPEGLVALGLLGLLTAVNLVGIKQSAWLNIGFTLIEIGGLVICIVLGITDPEFGQGMLARVDGGTFSTAALVFFAYLGFEEVANLAEETRDPGRNVPRAILIAVVVTTALYVFVALAVVALAPPETLAGSDAPLATAVEERSPWWAGVLGGVALFATANTGLVAMVVTSRLLYGMARGGDAPPVLTKTLPGRQTPWVAALVVLGLAAALLPLGGVEVLASLSSLGALVGFFVVNACLILLRFREPDLERPFRVPVAIRGVPVFPVLGMLAVLALATSFSGFVYLAGAVVLVVGFIAHLLRGIWA